MNTELPATYPELIELGNSETTRKLVRLEKRNERYAIVTMDSPEDLHSLTPQLMLQLHNTLKQVTSDAKIKVVVLTGTEPAFCSGGNLNMIASGARNAKKNAEGTTNAWRWIRQQFGGVARLIANSNAIFISAVNGPCAGVGLAFALACDVIIASKEQARFVPAFGKLGLVPEVGTSWFLTRRVGYQGAFAFFVKGETFSAEKAFQIGMCQEVVPHADLNKAVEVWVTRCLSMPPHALEMTKVLLRSAVDLPFEATLRMEEFAEAVMSFMYMIENRKLIIVIKKYKTKNCFSTVALSDSADKILKSRM